MFAVCFSAVNSLVVAGQSDGEAKLRSLTEKFFDAYQKEDLDGLLQMWSTTSPDLLANKEALQKVFIANGQIDIKNLSIRKIEVERGRVRVSFDLTSVDVKTAKLSAESGRQYRTIYFVNERGSWNVSKYVSSEEDLAAALAAAKSNDERAALLETEKELLTARLQKPLSKQVTSLAGRGRYNETIPLLEIKRSIAERLGDTTALANSLLGFGIVKFVYRDFSQALDYYNRALQIASDAGDRETMASAFHNIGKLHSSQGNYMQAVAYYQRSLKLAEAEQSKGVISTTLNNLGVIHVLQGNYQQATDCFQKSLMLAEETGEKLGILWALNNIGSVHSRRGNYTQALDYYERSLKIADSLGFKGDVAGTLINIGRVLRIQGNYQEALESFQTALRLAEEGNSMERLVRASANIAYLKLLQRDFAESLESASRAAMLAKQGGLLEDVWPACTTAGTALRALGNIDQARKEFEDAISSIEMLRSNVAGGAQPHQQYFENKLDPYLCMADLLVKQNNPEGALAYVERAKSRVLVDVLSNGKFNIVRNPSQQEQEQERKLHGELILANRRVYREKTSQRPDQTRVNQLEADLNRARLAYEEFQANLHVNHPDLKIRRGRMQPIDIKQASSLIEDADTAVLEFVVADDRTFIFALTPERSGADEVSAGPALKVHTLKIKLGDLAERIKRFRRSITDRDLSARNEAKELYDLLIGPVRTHLTGKKRLIIVPDGPLWELPFQALQSAPKRFLIEDWAISYAPSLTTLFHMSQQRARPQKRSATLLAIGNPAVEKETAEAVQTLFIDEKLGPLPEAERLVKTVGRMYGPTRCKVYTGAEAREEHLKAEAPKYDIIHIAAHGILNNKSPMYSQLVLSQADGNPNEDGLLEAWEIMNLELKANLVILSACDSGLGRIGDGEGVIGLSWACFIAGAPATVVSQWKVESSSTTELMIEFHRNLRLGKSKAEALRLASLKLLKTERYRHPFYWAGFVIIGDAR